MDDLDRAYEKYVKKQKNIKSTSALKSVEDRCIIDIITRQIAIPESFKIAGVMADNNTRRIFFKCSKTAQITDLSKLNICINYLNANQEADRYHCDDVEIIGEYLTFSWLISNFATKYKGNIAFIVCMYNEGTEEHWNSTLAELEVLEGLETTETVIEQNPDILEEILSKMEGIEETGKQVADCAVEAKESLKNICIAVNGFDENYTIKVEEFNLSVKNANNDLDKKIEDVNFEIDKKMDKNLGEENANKLLGTDGEGNVVIKDDIQLTAENISYNSSNVDLALDDVYNKLGDLMYMPISITSLTNNKNTVEIGSVITDVVLNWNYNKVPTKLTLDNQELDVNLKTKTLSGQNISSNKNFTLKATDERNAVATKTTSITFLNGVYHGVGDNLEIDSIANEFILSLTKTLQSSKAKTFTVSAGEDKHIYYVIPSRYGTPVFKVGGFEGGFGKLGTFNFTNSSGYAENYDIYKSGNSNLGNTTVVVS